MTSPGQLRFQMLRRAWSIWKRVGQVVGDFVGRMVLTLFYFTVFAPFGLGVRLWGDPLAINRQHGTQWLERETRDQVLSEARRLF
jgi:hypothetical protein